MAFAQRKQIKKKGWCHLVVCSNPHVRDPKEMRTILTCSLRNLWGDLEPHSCLMEILKHDENSKLLIVRCRRKSMSAVRAALTLVTLPPYLESTNYRFDVIETVLSDDDDPTC